MLFERHASKQRNPPGKVHTEQAEAILAYFKREKVYPGQYDPRKWASELRSIAEFTGEPDLARVLAYLTEQHKGQPAIRTLRDFKDRFGWLKDLADAAVIVSAPQGPVQTVIQKLQEYYPRHSHKNLTVTVQKSSETITKIKAKIPNLMKAQAPKIKSKAGGTLGSEVFYLNEVLTFMRDAIGPRLLETYFKFVFDTKGLGRWKDWSGKTSAYAFDPAADLFLEFWPVWMHCDVRHGERFVKEYTNAQG